LLGLPSLGGIGGCDLGVCGGVTPISGFEADAQAIQQAAPWVIRVVVVCAATPGCQEALVAVAVGAVAGAAVVGVAYGGYQTYKYFSKGGTEEVGHDYVRDMARAMGGDYCTALKTIRDNARKAGNSKLFNAAKATYKEDCRGK